KRIYAPVCPKITIVYECGNDVMTSPIRWHYGITPHLMMRPSDGWMMCCCWCFLPLGKEGKLPEPVTGERDSVKDDESTGSPRHEFRNENSYHSKKKSASLVKLRAEPLRWFDSPELMFSRVDRASRCGKFKRTRRRGERRLTEKVDK
ncbi:hypothetical protein TNCV_3662081, partial [Trichonephila clavipes]